MYQNNGDGTFSSANLAPLTTDSDASVSASWGDYDNDGYPDLFVANNINSNNRLYHNNGDGTFTDVTRKAGVINKAYGLSATVADSILACCPSPSNRLYCDH